MKNQKSEIVDLREILFFDSSDNFWARIKQEWITRTKNVISKVFLSTTLSENLNKFSSLTDIKTKINLAQITQTTKIILNKDVMIDEVN